MFTYSDLKQTRIYQDAMLEGEQRGLQIGEQRGLQRQASMLLRMLTRKFGKISPSIKSQISKLFLDFL